MSEKRIVVPEGMIRAACRVGTTVASEAEPILKAALLHMTENPIVPTDAQAEQLLQDAQGDGYGLYPEVIAEWQRRMFLAAEPEVPVVIDKEKERFREALEKLAKLGNGDIYGNSEGNAIAQEALGINRRSPLLEMKFIECDACRAKSGSPTLCRGCLHNRQVIEAFEHQRAQASLQKLENKKG